MIIEPRIRLSVAEIEALKQPLVDIELALEITGRVQHALRTNSFNVVQYATDHKTNEEGELVDTGEIAIRVDADGNKL